jgi:DNA-binding LacI/PurR family transcriptional regulator
MADVAALAGVSGQTVSRVVNASPRVDPATRHRVEQAMERLGYRPHPAARALRTGRTQTIGLVASTLASVGNSRMLQAVADAASTRSYAVVVVTLGERRELSTAFDRLRDQGVDGAIVLNEASRLARETTPPDDFALVVIDSPPDARFDVIDIDHAGGARAATEHLLSLGHRTVAHVAGPEGSFAAAERERGWREALAAVAAPTAPIVRGDWTSASGHAAGVALARDLDTTAVFAANDQMALGLVRAMTEAGRDVPADVSVVGFDDLPDAADYRPPLTTVRQDFDTLGERAVATVVQAIDGVAAHSFERLPARLVERESTAPPR